MSCAGKIETGLRATEGVSSVVVDMSAKTATIKFDAEKTNAEALLKKIESIGYQAS